MRLPLANPNFKCMKNIPGLDMDRGKGLCDEMAYMETYMDSKRAVGGNVGQALCRPSGSASILNCADIV